MKRTLVLSAIVAVVCIGKGASQQLVTDVGGPNPSHMDLATGMNVVRANAPPVSCGCFTAFGGFVSANFSFGSWLSVTGDGNVSHASKISALSQNLTLTTAMIGPRVSWDRYRYVPFTEFLLGTAHGSGSYFPSQSSSSSSATSFAYAVGGGIDLNLSDRWAIRPFDAEYLHSSLPNGASNSQNELRIKSGIVFHVGRGAPPVRYVSQAPPALIEVPPSVSLSCTAITPEVEAGHSIQIVAEPTFTGTRNELSYRWTSSGGTVEGAGQMVAIDTSNLAPGTYQVEGDAGSNSDPKIASTCKTAFRVKEPATTASAIQTEAPVAPSMDLDGFAQHVRDLFFNYDRAELSEDAQHTLTRNAAYMIAHPEVRITIAGYADERGSAEYNIALGLQRALSSRQALISAGIEESRVQVLSYGKEKPFCTDDNEACYQQNRRAQFILDGR